MRHKLRLAAALLPVVCVAAWILLGANRGWTKTTRTRFEKDPVADDMLYPVIEKHFSPGLDLLGTGLLVSAALAGLSFTFQQKPKH